MRITFNEDVKSGRELFEAGNTIETTKHGISDARAERWWQRGWVEVEGWDKAPERQPGAQKLKPGKTKSGQKES